MKYYLGTPYGNTFFNQAMLETNGTGSILFTFAEQNNPQLALKTLTKYDNFNIIIDSGAFSVWNSGKVMDRNILLNYYKKLKEYRSDLLFINLDVIPGERNRKPTPEEAYIACEKGLENYYFFKKNGINTLPVFHEGDDFKFLQIFKNETDYIAISPANDSSRVKRQVWLDRVYADLKANYKTHGLAATAVPLLERYPFYSVDSINWKTSVIYGNGKHYSHEVTSKLARDNNHKLSLLKKDIEYYVGVEKYITNLWKKRGVVWE